MRRGKPLIVTATLGATLAGLLCAVWTPQKPHLDGIPPGPRGSETAKRTSACALVTQEEMSAILGVTVTAQDTTHSAGETACSYSAPSGFPTVEMEVDWEDGDAAMEAFAMLNRTEPGIGNPYDGVGDQAVAVGPTLMIRIGDDLMKLVFSGVDAAPAKARRIFQTAKSRFSS